MRLTITPRQTILCGIAVLLVGIGAGQAKAQAQAEGQGQGRDDREIELLSYSFGIVQGQKARITVALRRLANPHKPNDPVSVRIQLLDVDGEVIAESGDLRVLPGQTRSWDQLRALLPASGEPGGRIQLRARILCMTKSADLDRIGLMPSIEVIDTLTGGTVYHAGKTFLIFVSAEDFDTN
jgi:hypothetical protein